ncbi:hypothetical protein SPRG_19468 [Saprolegnia parasitica CBS 223.65]|uniref:SBF1/SBF2 domain-containing protein n=1 Tax=Saprolegnia parasitica (strain CBS 223.65) TaxID=695850 RepID=A0A067CYQ4_SAPPC|nr:hypothetical protein SPRG_19468 [Saprolegnia parasitica CBS 223.65]KDO31937.1 hypothetical protein SPRG_19468 [Saprolegnia parasitica CBS 223.65]|eukprot:XP_012197397.1 hypothetical protein SPRG_19468 [Saprolegnia parasitica CBS 223.65]
MATTTTTTLPPPPYMLGERPTPFHAGDGSVTFRQVPYVSVHARIEKGTAVRKHLKKYLESSSHSHSMMAHAFLSDAHVASMQPEEISKSSMDDVFRCLQRYNHTVGTKSMEVAKALSQLASPLDNAGRVKKWNKDNYNIIQKCVQDVAAAEKRMERAIARRDKAIEEHAHWKRICEMNAGAVAMQPTNADCQRALSVSLAKANAAAEEERIGLEEYEACKNALHSAIEHRDDMVEESTEASQMMEEDRLETMVLILQQFIQVKQSALAAEMDSLRDLARMVSATDRSATIQQYILDHMQPDITHRHSKALFLLEWHWKWHLERIELARNEPDDYLALESDALPCLQSSGMTVHDVEVMKDFIACCFVEPDLSRMILDPTKVSTRHRRRFVDPKSKALYRMDTVRKVLVAALNHQRTHSLTLSAQGYEALVASMNLLLHGCMDRGDTKCAKSVMNMAQTFYCIDVDGSTHKYLLDGIVHHPIWQTAHFWGDAVLMSIGEELSRNPMETPWHYWPPAKRASLVLSVHNTVFGQLSTYLYNMAAFRMSKHQIMQFVQNVAFSFELSEDQRIVLLASANGLDTTSASDALALEGGDAAMFTTAIFPEWRQRAPPGRTPLQKMRHGLSKIKGIFDQDSAAQAASTQALLANAQKTSEVWESLFGDDPKKALPPSDAIELATNAPALSTPSIARVESEDEGRTSRVDAAPKSYDALSGVAAIRARFEKRGSS